MTQADDHILDQPVWSALTSHHAAFAHGGALAKRYDPSIIPFAATRDDSDAALEALAALPGPDETMVIAQARRIVLPPQLVAEIEADAVQMILRRAPPEISDTRIAPLSEADAKEMLQLAALTRPGPFTLRAQALGKFFGVKIDGRLAAMAGERMGQPGFAEVSGVCTHPDFQGRGLGRLLSVFMTHRVLARGETPYLHAYATNAGAIRLYEAIGYALRREMKVAVVKPAAGAAGR